jgi:AraC-like DNA-binding protein
VTSPFCLLILCVISLVYSNIQYEFRADIRPGDTTYKALFGNNEFVEIIKIPIFDSSGAVKIRLTEGKACAFVKNFPILPKSYFRFNFAYDTLGPFDTLAWAKRTDWTRSEIGQGFSIFSLISDNFSDSPTVRRFFRYNLKRKGNQLILRYVIDNTGTEPVWQYKAAGPILPGQAYCLESMLLVDKDSTAKHLTFWMNGKKTWDLDVSPLKYKLKNQIVRMGNTNVKYRCQGNFFIDNIAFASTRMGDVPRTPVLDSRLAENSDVMSSHVLLSPPVFKQRLVDAIHQSTRYQIHLSGQDFSLPLYDSGPSIKNKDSIQARIVLDPGKEYVWRMRHFSRRGSMSDWSNQFPLVYKSDVVLTQIQEEHPRVVSAFFAVQGKQRPIHIIEKGKWYDFNIKIATGASELAYAIFWCNTSDYTFGNEANRGGKFLPADNYAYNFSIDPDRVYEKRHEGKYNYTKIPGSQGIYLDAQKDSYFIKQDRSLIRCRARFPKEARAGIWSLRGFVRNAIEKSSPMFYATFKLAEAKKTIPKKPKNNLYRILIVVLLAGVLLLIILLFRAGKKTRVTVITKDEEVFNRFKTYVDEYLDHELAGEEIASHLSINYSTLYKIVKRVSKKSIKNYVLSEKIEKAKKLLKSTSLNIQDVGQEVGFQDSFHFSKTFKKHTGKSPQNFRKDLV